MALAARLNLRLQKELKLLMTDPPPGVSFPSLSDNQNQSSLSLLTIESCIFIVKIQIPERYPFQPPNVTFVIPIYHPNIDNGGRICLDILNLLPKGAWQPSMSISTILTSIRLLLSEPNPDDALMAEIKARTWTERFTNPDIAGKIDNHAVSTSLNVVVDIVHCFPIDSRSLIEQKLGAISYNRDLENCFCFFIPTCSTLEVPLEAHGALVPENPDQGRDRMRKKLRLSFTKLTTTPVMPSGMNDNAEKEVIVLNNEILDMPAKQSGTTPEFLDSIIASDSEESGDDDNPPLQSRLSRKW
ncbi:hypothetical protein ZIOFF_030746 [Zingiber officinale]|uniref:UBC core domain-containing protein n=1 Tax=Zingiber officinale TaxID=94328 RepID=A0A8J5LBZ6_ZINOF|nr:hypothetical protein ZIOFF_030746 [Zingiber officinale]